MSAPANRPATVWVTGWRPDTGEWYATGEYPHVEDGTLYARADLRHGVNLDAEVLIRLTPTGRGLWSAAGVGDLPPTDDAGWARLPLRRVMAVFGPYLLSGHAPFEATILVPQSKDFA